MDLKQCRIAASVIAVICVTGLASAQFTDEGRDKHEKVAELLAALRAEPGKRIADVGAGDGFYSVLRGILIGLKPGGRLVIVEPIHDVRRSADRATQTAKHEISDQITAEELQAAGFEIERRAAAFRPFSDPEGTGGWWLIVATKPAS